MRCISICAPARMGKQPETFEILVDTGNDMVELRSEDGKNSIILDLACAAEFDRNFHALVQGEPFQMALEEKISNK